MKYDEVMQLAKDIHEDGLFRFVAAIEAAAVAAERERLAVLFETYKEVNADIIPESHDVVWRSNTIASFIRARGDDEPR